MNRMQSRRLVYPVIGAIIATYAAMVWVAFFGANQLDQSTFEKEQTIISNALSNTRTQLSLLTEDNAYWDDTVDNLIINPNENWFNRTYGETVGIFEQADGIFVTGKDQTVLFSTINSGDVSGEDIIEAGLSPILERIIINAPTDTYTTHALVRVKNRVIIAGISALQSQDPNNTLPSGVRESIVYFQIFTPQDWLEFGERSAIRNLSFSTEPSQNHRSMPLTGANDKVLGYLTWENANPGSDLMLSLAIPIGLLSLILFAVILGFVAQTRKIMLSLDAANSSKSTFLASMSHEIRTPLNSIIGFADLLKTEKFGKIEGEKNKDYLDQISNSGLHLLQIINEILDMSKLEAGKFERQYIAIDPGQIIDDTVGSIEPLSMSKNIIIECNCASMDLVTDPRIMRQVLLNILSNAVKFTPDEGKISITGEIVNDVYYRVVITDTGAGMSNSDIKKALSLFGQVQDEFTKSHGGTGLGLPLVHRFMKLLDGRLDITSTPGEGTNVTLEFPNEATHIDSDIL